VARSFDAAVSELSRAATGTDLVEVARAYEDLADVAAQLAEAVAREHRASGLREAAQRSA
jgi:uncharacterized protein with PhoU and TrkA domain